MNESAGTLLTWVLGNFGQGTTVQPTAQNLIQLCAALHKISYNLGQDLTLWATCFMKSDGTGTKSHRTLGKI